MGNLTIIATPIGNIQDISARAINSLVEADVLLAEDTRKLLHLIQILEKQNSELSITGAKIRFDEHSEQKKIPEVIKWLDEDKKVVLVSDAGTPLLSDPGYYLVKTLLAATNHQITSIPGPSAVTNALVLSGLPPYPFMFIGYLPRKTNDLLKRIQQTVTISEQISSTFVAFDSPHRIIKTLETLSQSDFKEIQFVILSEMTKQFEKRLKGTPEELIKQLQSIFEDPKGEFVLLWHV